MKTRTRTAIAWGCFGAWIVCVVCAVAFRSLGHGDAAKVCGLVSLPWLAGAIRWGDA